jgi:tRNA nucleotidyltransferase (CCA-adding enzyme)
VKCYKVGGAVRDILLGQPATDVDWVVVGATPEQMLAEGFKPVGKDFPVFLHPDTREEYALARTERKTGPGYHGFSFHTAPDVTLKDDLQRRDLTINAMAMDENGDVIDPFGGQQDLQRGLLRHVSPAFVEDPVRILRVARFAARYGFDIAAETRELMAAMVVAGEADHLVPERCWQELEQALAEPQADSFFRVLHDCGALAKVLPELDAGYSSGVAERALTALKLASRLTNSTTIRFAALMQDLSNDQDGEERARIALIETACRRLKAPNAYRELSKLAARCCPMFAGSGNASAEQLLTILKRADAFRRPRRFAELITVCHANHLVRHGGDIDATYPPAAVLERALTIARQIDTQALVEAGLEGNELAAALDNARAKAIAADRQGR